MIRFLLGIVLLILGMGSMATGQESATGQIPRITLMLPPGAPSEAVQINYFMAGAFGGYGNFIRAEKGQVAYSFVAGVEGKPALTVKIIAYVPGCEIVTLTIAMEDTAHSRDLPCKPLGYVQVRGLILPTSVLEGAPAKIEVTYLASWDHKFFGIADGLVTSIHIATIVPDQIGRFEVEVPDFYTQNLKEGEFRLTLRAANSWNIIAFLKASDDALGLPVLSSYPHLVNFVAKMPQSVESR